MRVLSIEEDKHFVSLPQDIAFLYRLDFYYLFLSDSLEYHRPMTDYEGLKTMNGVNKGDLLSPVLKIRKINNLQI